MNELLFKFSSWVGNMESSQNLLGSFYMWNWIESAHVLTLMIFLGVLFVIDLRMLGFTMTSVPASTVWNRLKMPMFIGLAIMLITGTILWFANAVHETHSLWFRLKMVFLIAAFINAMLFHRVMESTVSQWDTDPVPPKRIRMGAATSLTFWIVVVFFGRFMAYNWFDCDLPQGEFVTWAAGCDLL